MRAVPRTSSSTKTSLGEGLAIHVAHMGDTIHDEEVPQAKTPPSEEVVRGDEVIRITTEDLHIKARLRGSGSSRVKPDLCTVVVSIFHVCIIPYLGAVCKPFVEFIYVLDPMLIESSRVVLSSNRTVYAPKVCDELTLRPSLDPPIKVFLDSSRTPTSLISIPFRASLVNDTILVCLTILCVAYGCYYGCKLTHTLRAYVDLDGIIKHGCTLSTILGVYGLGGCVCEHSTTKHGDSQEEP